MAKSSFSLLVPNLFVGLTKGARGLGEHGRGFKQLGYRVFRLEPRFLLSKGNTCNPDLVLSSGKMSHTLILEWTNAASIHEAKREQFRRYSKISSGDLVNGLAVPRKEAGSFDVIVVVSREAVGSFRKFLTTDKLPFVLLEFTEAEQQFSLRKISGTFKDKETERFFSRSLSLARIPLRYVPFPLDNTQLSELVTHIVTHILSLVTRGVAEFGIDEFCSGFVSVWTVVDQRKRGEVSRATKDLIDRLARKPVGRGLLLRQRSDPPRWQLLQSSIGQTQLRSLHSRLDEFIREVKGGSYQLDLPLDEVPSEDIHYGKSKPPGSAT
jgi:hypothetical protein